MQELTFEQVEEVSGGFQGLTGPEDLFHQLTDFYMIDSSIGTNGGPTNKCKSKLGALSCLAETAGLAALFNDMVDFVSTNGPVAWDSFVEYANEKAQKVNENGGPRKRL
ncbi:hypothetical protein [Alishewanella sp. SMS8]|uniref:hypothetical protein n=1 Tax=Alishewanella sp. SMS8 TaxID=2994676 RepID=UPI0027420793|nr:hypothetical protein [Alishewanella sp. SMS8]MDP5206778.1 hypothetical protein [Alishewanella sp. SMS9]MDP5458811.1 hypothetical protein [Alishewanella sp. SMS8]